jgi:hypothetical protein
VAKFRGRLSQRAETEGGGAQAEVAVPAYEATQDQTRMGSRMLDILSGFIGLWGRVGMRSRRMRFARPAFIAAISGTAWRLVTTWLVCPLCVWLMAVQGIPTGPRIIGSPANVAFAKASLAELKPKMDAADGIRPGQ